MWRRCVESSKLFGRFYLPLWTQVFAQLLVLGATTRWNGWNMENVNAPLLDMDWAPRRGSQHGGLSSTSETLKFKASLDEKRHAHCYRKGALVLVNQWIFDDFYGYFTCFTGNLKELKRDKKTECLQPEFSVARWLSKAGSLGLGAKWIPEVKLLQYCLLQYCRRVWK